LRKVLRKLYLFLCGVLELIGDFFREPECARCSEHRETIAYERAQKEYYLEKLLSKNELPVEVAVDDPRSWPSINKISTLASMRREAENASRMKRVVPAEAEDLTPGEALFEEHLRSRHEKETANSER
jgi:hypothetical protein